MRKLFLKAIGTLSLLMALATAGFDQNPVQCLIGNVWVPCSVAVQAQFAQAPLSQVSSGSVASINKAYGSNVSKGNTLVVAFANGNNNQAASPITDTLSLTWFRAGSYAVNGSAFESAIYFAPVTGAGGAETVTVTPGGTNASIAMTIYEVPGLIFPAATSSPTGNQGFEQGVTATSGSAATSPPVQISPAVPNEYVFSAFALGTAAQTITVVSPLNNDSGQQNPTTPAGLFSFVSSSTLKPDITALAPSATATSEPWAVVTAAFRTLSLPIQGTVKAAPLPLAGLESYTASSTVNSVASATDIAVLPGNATNTVYVYDMHITCLQTTAGIVTVNIIKRSTADTGGTSGAMTVVPDDANYPAGVSAPLTYTANPTGLGSTIGNVDTVQLGCMATGTTSPNDFYLPLDWKQKPIVLRGTAQQLAVNLGGVTVTGGSFAITFKYIETTQPLP